MGRRKTKDKMEEKRGKVPLPKYYFAYIFIIIIIIALYSGVYILFTCNHCSLQNQGGQQYNWSEVHASLSINKQESIACQNSIQASVQTSLNEGQRKRDKRQWSADMLGWRGCTLGCVNAEIGSCEELHQSASHGHSKNGDAIWSYLLELCYTICYGCARQILAFSHNSMGDGGEKVLERGGRKREKRRERERRRERGLWADAPIIHYVVFCNI